MIPDDDGPHPALVSGVRPAAATTLAWGALPDAAPGAAAAPTAVGSAPAPGPALLRFHPVPYRGRAP